MLSLLQQRYGNSFGLYRDDGLGTSALSPKQAEKVKQEICGIFQENDLRITIEVKKSDRLFGRNHRFIYAAIQTIHET